MPLAWPKLKLFHVFYYLLYHTLNCQICLMFIMKLLFHFFFYVLVLVLEGIPTQVLRSAKQSIGHGHTLKACYKSEKLGANSERQYRNYPSAPFLYLNFSSRNFSTTPSPLQY